MDLPARMKPFHWGLNRVLRVSGWLQYGRHYCSPIRPDRLLWVNPAEIERKPAEKPPTDKIPPTLIVGGDWDRDLEPITEDIVFECFQRRFEHGISWEESGYVEFLSKDVSEHGNLSTLEAKQRCRQIDRLYEFIRTEGYITQHELEREDSLIDELTDLTRPSAYREVSVDVTRDGELVWHGGMHRLAIAKLLELDEIPIRINIRHKQWQTIREAIYTGKNSVYREAFEDHIDIEYLLTNES